MERIIRSLYLIMIIVLSFSCKKESNNVLIKKYDKDKKISEDTLTKVQTPEIQKEEDTETQVKYDTLFLKVDDIATEYIGTRKFPEMNMEIENMSEFVKNNGLIYILDASSYIIVAKNNALFTSYIDDYIQKYLLDKPFLIKSGYRLEALEEPIGATLLKKGKDSIVYFNNNDRFSLESFCIENKNELASLFLDGDYKLKSFLTTHGINLPKEDINGEIILVCNQIVEGSWFDRYRKSGYYKKTEDFGNFSVINQYKFTIRNDSIQSLCFGELIGF